MPNLVPSRYCIRTSNCRTFRRCRRQWGYASSMRRNLTKQGTEQNIHFWFGTAIHFAMEDFFGYNHFGDPREAFKAYYEAFPSEDLPPYASEHYDLGMGMLTYFLEWYPKYNSQRGFQTVWTDDAGNEVEPHTPGGHPLVEEAFMLDLGMSVWVNAQTGDIIAKDIIQLEELYTVTETVAVVDGKQKTSYHCCCKKSGAEFSAKKEPIMYHGTIDRVVRDPHGNWYLWDWKTAKGADTNKLDTDDQITRYMWAAEQHFRRHITGFVYLQMTKEVPKQPKELKSGELSVDKKQKTTSSLLKKELIRRYGAVKDAPAKLIDFLNTLYEQESPEGDKFIRWDIVLRSREQKISTYYHIMGEAREMINPELYLYPTPTRDCIWDCSFREACLMEECHEYSNLEHYFNTYYQQRPHEENQEVDEWRVNIKWPEQPHELDVDKEFRMDHDVEDVVMNIILPQIREEI